MKIEVLPDETVRIVDGRGLTGIAAEGAAPLVNQLDYDELLAVLAGSKVQPYVSERAMQQIFNHTLHVIQTTPDQVFTQGKPQTTLGMLRKAVIVRIGGQFNDPLSQYLDAAVKVKQAQAA